MCVIEMILLLDSFLEVELRPSLLGALSDNRDETVHLRLAAYAHALILMTMTNIILQTRVKIRRGLSVFEGTLS